MTTSLPPSSSASNRAAKRASGRIKHRIERRFTTRKARRRLVIAWAVILLLGAMLPLVSRLQEVFGPAAAFDGIGMKLVSEPIAFFFIASLTGLVIRMAVQSVADQDDETLDEWQIAFRDRTYLLAYRGLAVGVVWLLLAAYIVADASATRQVSQLVSDWIMSYFLFIGVPFIAFLPSAVMAWHQPDDEEVRHD